MHSNLLLCHHLNIVKPTTTVLNVYSKFMITLWSLWRGYPDGAIQTGHHVTERFPSRIWKAPLILRSADSLWNAVSDGNSASCPQSWTVCSALLLPCCVTWSLHPFISLCLSFLICNIGIITYVTHLLYSSTNIKPLKALKRLGRYEIYRIYNAIL